MKKVLVLMIFALFLFSMIGFVLAVPAPCDDDELAENSNYGIIGIVEDIECGETFENTPCTNGSANILQECTAKVEIIEVLKGDYEIGDEIEIEFNKMYELNDMECIPGSFTESFTEGHKIKYYDASSSCVWSRLIDLGVAEDEDDEDDEDEENGRTSIKNKLQERNRLRINQSELPEGCTVSGSVLKCNINGQRTMVVFAGRSGNTILQVKGVNASTKVQLYKENDSFYGVAGDNRTFLINYFPDQIREIIQNRMNYSLEYEEEIELDDNGIYRVQTKKKARLFYLIPVREKVKAQVDAETGEIIKIRNPWWGFLAKDTVDDNQEEDGEDEEDEEN